MNERRVLIAYASKRGSARKAAEWIAAELGPIADIVDLKKSPPSGLKQYGTVVLGSGILAGKVYRPLQRFIDKHSEELNDKCICLFITHLEEGDGIEKDFRAAFKEEFLARARVRAGVGGRLKLKEINFFLRLIMKKISREAGKDFSNYDTLSREACIEFAGKVKERCLG